MFFHRSILDRTAKTALFIRHKNDEPAFNAGSNDGGVDMVTRILPGFFPALCVMCLLAASPARAQDPAVQTQGPGDISAVSAAQPVAQAVPIDMGDPLAEFRRAQAEDAASEPVPAETAAMPDATATTATTAPTPADPAATSLPTPLPTPGGFQQPGPDGPMDQNYNLDAVTEDVAAKQAELEQKAREQAFDAALNGMMPMSPEQIRALLDKYKVTREASEERIGGAPKPEVTMQTVSLEPGVAPPVVKLSAGHVTSITMMDITGQPWPVQDVSWGGNFEVISPSEGGHVIRVSPMAAHEVGNMSVQLVGLKTPVTFELKTQLDIVQYRFDARIPEYGPMASTPLIEPGLTIAAGSDKAMGQILDGVPPAGTEKMNVGGVDPRTSVYRAGDVTYLRTPLTLLSPGWSASVKSADGMTVYVVNNSPVFLLSDRGKMVRAVVEEHKADQ